MPVDELIINKDVDLGGIYVMIIYVYMYVYIYMWIIRNCFMFLGGCRFTGAVIIVVDDLQG